MKFRKRTPTVEAIQWDGRNEQEVLEFTLDGPTPLSEVTFQPSPRGRLAVLIIETGIRREAAPGDWIVREPSGRFYPVKQEVFATSYEPAPGKSHNVAPSTTATDSSNPIAQDARQEQGRTRELTTERTRTDGKTPSTQPHSTVSS